MGIIASISLGEISMSLRQYMNVICLLIGFLINKVSIVIVEGIIPGKGSVRKDVNAK